MPLSSPAQSFTRSPRIETSFDIPFIADLALHEKQIQQNYRPVIAVHKWFARRPGTLFRSLILAEFVAGPLRQTFYRSHQLGGVRIGDPFMGGGTPLLEANRLGCGITGFDINPMAYWIVRQEIEELDLARYQQAAQRVQARVRSEVGKLYETKCISCAQEVPVKYFIWVKTHACGKCGCRFPLLPGCVVAENERHPRYVLLCSGCNELNEVVDRDSPGRCRCCGLLLKVQGPAARSWCNCPVCGAKNHYPDSKNGPPTHHMVAIEYYCPHCRRRHHGRFFKRPDDTDLQKVEQAAASLEAAKTSFIPDEPIPAGDETDRLHRWGYRKYRQMFNDRQLLGLELLCRAISAEPDARTRHALATNLSDLLRYQNMLCRYDTRALKSLDIFSVHGFPVGLVQCESNLFGIPNGRPGQNVGSGGWSNIVDKFTKAKAYCQAPFEIKHRGRAKIEVPMAGEWIGQQCRDGGAPREVALHSANSATVELPPASLDAVLTDPPYFANVQYAELMDFCFVWLRRLAWDASHVFEETSTRSEYELTGNVTMERGLSHFTTGLSQTFARMAKALKPGAPFVFTYHHNAPDAYSPLVVAVLDAGLVCSASLPCPAEMGASIHINGTASSVVDTVFVCRSTGLVDGRTLVTTPRDIAGLVSRDADELSRGGLRVSQGDIRCLAYGHIARLAIWTLRSSWSSELSVKSRLQNAAAAFSVLNPDRAVERELRLDVNHLPMLPYEMLQEERSNYQAMMGDVAF